MPKPTDAALRKLRRKFGNAQTAGRVSKKAEFDFQVRRSPGKVKPPYHLYPMDARNGKDLTREVGGVGFTPTPRKTVIRRADREHIASLTLAEIQDALLAHGDNQTRAARRLGISPRTLVRLHQELMAQQAAEARAAVPPSAPPPASPPAPSGAGGDNEP